VPDRLRRWRLAPGRRRDAGLAAAIAGLALIEQLAGGDTEHSARAVAWILLIAAPLLSRSTHPVLATCAAALPLLAVPDLRGDFPPTVFEVVWPILLAYSCGAHAHRSAGLAATAGLTIAIQIHVGFADAPNLEIALTTLAPWWAGRQVRSRRRLVDELSERTRELEAEEESFVRLSVEHERARIARDLHDIVSHHLAVIVIQAGAGRLADGADAELAAARLAAIRDAAAQALEEADRLVALLHPEGAAPRLAALLASAQATGARVVVSPPDLSLTPTVEAIAYRVVQEALTNAMKHAPGADVDLRIVVDGGRLSITARNDRAGEGSAVAGSGSGLGLAGMRERLAAHGGSLTAGPDGDGGFRLCATLPAAEAGTGSAVQPPLGAAVEPRATSRVASSVRPPS
jgi:signal transduction histidine kinase